MSSTTTSTTVWPLADHPSSSVEGVKTRTFAVPCGIRRASRRWDSAAPETSTGSRPTRSSGATWR